MEEQSNTVSFNPNTESVNEEIAKEIINVLVSRNMSYSEAYQILNFVMYVRLGKTKLTF